jgi:RNA polymerase sigma-70 factor (ECF subfamily)
MGNTSQEKPDHQEDELIANIADGDQLAFNRLVQKHGPKLHNLALRFTGSAADADEIAQETLFRLWQSADKWQPGKARLSTWLFRITTNLCIDLARKKKRHMEISSADPPELIDDQPDTSTILQSRQELQFIEEQISQLPEKQKMTLLLSTQQGKSNKEIAQVLKLSEGAIEQLLVRARRSLRQAYREISHDLG